jgi:hypothetical protein
MEKELLTAQLESVEPADFLNIGLGWVEVESVEKVEGASGRRGREQLRFDTQPLV